MSWEDNYRAAFTADGVRTTLSGSSVVVNATISSTVEVTNDAGNPLPVIGVRGAATQSIATLGTTSLPVLNSNATRSYLQVVNDSDTVVYISLNGTAAANTGTRLNANGGSVVFDQFIPTGTVSGITTADAKKVLITEG